MYSLRLSHVFVDSALYLRAAYGPCLETDLLRVQRGDPEGLLLKRAQLGQGCQGRTQKNKLSGMEPYKNSEQAGLKSPKHIKEAKQQDVRDPGICT